jgi:hypothetical protein
MVLDNVSLEFSEVVLPSYIDFSCYSEAELTYIIVHVIEPPQK